VYARNGASLFKIYCASCHEDGTNGDSRVPDRDVLDKLTLDQILQSLEKGAMKAKAAKPAVLSAAQLQYTFRENDSALSCQTRFRNLHFAVVPAPPDRLAIC
jgi:hypothetical protein